MFRTLIFTFLIVFTLIASPAGAAGPEMCVTSSIADSGCKGRTAGVFESGTEELYARVSLPDAKKTKIEFTWYTPDGAVFSRAVKVGFYSGKDGAVTAWDRIMPEGLQGWWRVEAVYEGGILSNRFILTENRLVMTAVAGDKGTRLGAVRQADPLSETGRDVLVLASEDPEPAVRAAALSRMGGPGREWASDAVRRGLTDQDMRVRLAALSSASALAEPERRAAYVSALLSADAEVRRAGAGGLRGYEDEEAAGALLAALSDPDAKVRLEALSALAVMRAAGLDAHLEAMVRDPDPPVRAAAVDAALSLPESPARDRALAAAAAVRDALGRRALDGLLGRAVPEALDAYMTHFRDGYRKRDTLIAVASVKDGRAAGYLAEAYRSSGGDEKLRLIAVSGLAERDGAAADILDEALSDSSAPVRLEAVRAAETLSDDGQKAGLLSRALSDSDPAVRTEAFGGLAVLGTREAMLKLVDLLGDQALGDTALARLEYALTPELMEKMSEKGRSLPDSRRRRRILSVLAAGGLGADEVGKYLGDPDPAVRKDAFAALRNMRTPESRVAAAAALGDDGLKYDAVEYIRGGMTPELVRMLAAAGPDEPDPQLRRRIVEALGDGGLDVHGLAAYLEDGDTAVRVAAVDAIAKAGGPEGQAIVIGMLDDPALADEALARLKAGLTPSLCGALAEKGSASADPALRLNVVRTLASCGLAAGGPLLVFLDDQDAGVANAAVDSLEDLILQTPPSSDRDGEDGLVSLLAKKGTGISGPDLRLRVVGVLSGAGAGTTGLVRYLEDPNSEVRAAALEAIAGTGEPDAYDSIMVLLDDPELRDAALRAIEPGLTPGAVEKLDVRAHGFADPGFRLRLVRMLAANGLDEPRLTAYMEDQDPDVRVSVVDFLSARRTGEAAYGLYLAGNDPEARVRDAAMAGLRKMDTAQLKEGLELLFARGRADGRTVGFIAGGLRKPGLLEALVDNIPAGDSARMGEALLPLINEGDVGSGMLALVKDGLSPGLLKELADRGRLMSDGTARLMLVNKLAEKGLGADGLIPYLEDDEPKVRMAAVKGLAGLGDAWGAYGLFLSGRDTSADVRAEARTHIRAMSGAALAGGIDTLFAEGEADRPTLEFAASAVEDPAALEAMVKNVPADDTPRLGTVLRPIIRSNSAAAPALVEGLKAEDNALFISVVRALCRVDAPAAKDGLARAYRERPGQRDEILGEAKAGVHAAAVIGLALDDEDAEIRTMAAEAVGGLPGGQEAGALLVRSLSDPDERVRIKAASSAGRIGDVQALARAAGDGSAAVRLAAAKALVSVSGRRVAEILGTLALDGDDDVSDAAVHGLEAMGTAVETPIWATVAGSSGRSKARAAALKALAAGHGGPDPAAVKVIARALSDKDPNVSELAEGILMRFGRGSLEAVYPVLSDPGGRERALEVIGRVADPSSEGRVLELLPGLDGPSLVLAVEVLGRLGGPASLDALTRLYGGADAGTRVAILKAVPGLDIKSGEQGLAGLLSEALGSEDERLRFYAARAAGEKGVAELRGRLTSMLESEGSALVRSEIERALGRL